MDHKVYTITQTKYFANFTSVFQVKMTNMLERSTCIFLSMNFILNASTIEMKECQGSHSLFVDNSHN